jgi:CRP-like cAMP-binding protein
MSSSNWPRNRLLLALPARNLKQLMPELEQIRCQRGQVLMDADSSLHHVFFPDSGVVSVVAVYADGSIIEMATIGREGCTGTQAIFGAKSSSVRLLVQIPGSATKMSRAAFTRATESMPAFRSLMYDYVQAFLEQVMVSVSLKAMRDPRDLDDRREPANLAESVWRKRQRDFPSGREPRIDRHRTCNKFSKARIQRKYQGWADHRCV